MSAVALNNLLLGIGALIFVLIVLCGLIMGLSLAKARADADDAAGTRG